MRPVPPLTTLRIPCNVSLGVFEQPLSASGNPLTMRLAHLHLPGNMTHDTFARLAATARHHPY